MFSKECLLGRLTVHMHLFKLIRASVRGCVRRHICAWQRVFLGVFSGREVSDMMTDITLIIHTHKHTRVGRLKQLAT